MRWARRRTPRAPWAVTVQDASGRTVHAESFTGSPTRAANAALKWILFGYRVILSAERPVSKEAADEIREALVRSGQ